MAETRVKVAFPSPEARQSDLIGILRQQDGSSTIPSSDSQPKPLILILHGVLAHKDQLYHRQLAKQLPIDSFRFDFRANAESPGEWGMGDFEEDLEDLHVVIKHLRQHYNYHVEAMIGHSRGALVGWYYFSDVERRKQGTIENKERYILDDIPCWAAISGRWRMDRIHDRDSYYEPAFAEKGYYSWEVKVMGQKVTAHVKREDVDKFASYPIEEKVAEFPTTMDCLLMQGTSDKAVPPADIAFYLNKLNEKQRRPQSAQIHLVDDADHNFRGHFDEVINVLCRWISQRGRNCDSEAAKNLQSRLKPIANPGKASL